MTENDWDGCADVAQMLSFLRDSKKASERKLRLFACALCRRVWVGIHDAACRRAVEATEAYADDLLPRARMLAAGKAASAAWRRRGVGNLVWWETPVWAGRYAALGSAVLAGFHVAGRVSVPGAHCVPAERVAATLREILGPLPFRPLAIAPSLAAWNAGLVLKLAKASYEERSLPSGHLDPARLLVLADALEDAGCQNEELLSHLRNGATHVRGCWTIDLLLNRK